MRLVEFYSDDEKQETSPRRFSHDFLYTHIVPAASVSYSYCSVETLHVKPLELDLTLIFAKKKNGEYCRLDFSTLI